MCDAISVCVVHAFLRIVLTQDVDEAIVFIGFGKRVTVYFSNILFYDAST